jgi:hypothetical protein
MNSGFFGVKVVLATTIASESCEASRVEDANASSGY